MKYGAITLDTSVFDQQGLNLESGLLKTLEQFKGKPAPLVLSEVVLKETNSHLIKRIAEARIQTTKALRASKAHLTLDETKTKDAEKLLIPAESDEEIATKRLDDFVNKTGANIIPANGHVEIDELIKRYFSSEAPFSESGKKKSEFPDAIALISLESWAKENKLKVLAVSNDKDWKEFAEQSDYIDVVEELADAISIFQPHNKAVEYSQSLSKQLPLNKPKEIFSFIVQFLSEAVSDIDAYPEANSQFYWEPEDIVEIKFEEFDFSINENNEALLQPVQVEDNLITIEAKVVIHASASCEFSLYVHDSIDKDYVPMGNSTAFTPIEFEAEILFTLEGDFVNEPDEVEITDIELLSHPMAVDFGDIEPDWWADND